MPAVDQAPRGLLVPGWVELADGRVMALPVIVVSEETGDWGGMTLTQASERAGLSNTATRQHLEAGYLPGQKPRARGAGPRTRRTTAWREKHLPRELLMASEAEIAAHYGVSVGHLHNCIRLDHPPGAPVPRGPKGPRLSSVKLWRAKHLPKALRELSGQALAAHFGVSYHSILYWAKHGLPPRKGGYRRGPRATSPVDRLTQILKTRQKSPLVAIMGGA